MPGADQDALDRGFSLLDGLANALKDYRYTHIDEKYVREFHAALDVLEGGGFSVAEFRIPNDAIERYERQAGEVRGMAKWETRRHVERPLFMAKLSAVRSYFEVSGHPRKVLGFRPPTENG